MTPVDGQASPGVELVLEAHGRDLGGFTVRRALPAMQRRAVGPFVFWDHMGPVELTPVAPHGRIDVRPHPHIGLATITLLFDGAILHRDSLGSHRVIQPGDVDWMVAGRGIVHSERTPPDARPGRMHGLQTWVALPLAEEETEPRFEHHAAGSIPSVALPGVDLRVFAGTGYGRRAPTGVLSPTLYVHARMTPGSTLPVDEEHEERAVYVIEGTVECEGRRLDEAHLAVLRPGAHLSLTATTAASVMLLGGALLDAPRHVWWNFVSSSRERIERAKDDWRRRRFAAVPGDDVEFIPLPEGSS
jgi:redox-sensitive bicupin YhaK (pirin superfamily)